MELYEGLRASATFPPFKSRPAVTRKGNVCIGLKGGVKDWPAESGDVYVELQSYFPWSLK